MKKSLFYIWIFLPTCFLQVSYSQTFMWAKSIGGILGDEGSCIKVDNDGNSYITGHFSISCDFDPNAGIVNLMAQGANDIFVLKLDAAGNFLWAKTIGGTGHDEGSSLALDAMGNIHITGTFEGTVDFDPGPGNSSLTANADDDIFILKLDTDGNFIWAKSMGGHSGISAYNDWGKSIIVDNSGNVYSTGFFTDTADFDPGPGVYMIGTSLYKKFYIQKLGPNGNFLWTHAMGNGMGNGISLDNQNNVYVTGYFNGTVDFDPSSDTFNLSGASGGGIFILKLNENGHFIWAKEIAGNNMPKSSRSIQIDASGNVYVCGYFDTVVSPNGLDFDPGPGVHYLLSPSNSDFFILKLDTDGNFIWVKATGSFNYDYSNSLAIDINGNAYITGSWSGYSIDMDPGPGIYELTGSGASHIFIQKLDPSGNFVWATSFGGKIGGDIGNSIFVDAGGIIYTVGYFSDTVDFDPTQDIFELISNGVQGDIFIQKIRPGIVGIEDITSNDFIIYPNPATDYLHISGNNLQLSSSTLSIQDLQGRTLWSSGATSLNLEKRNNNSCTIFKQWHVPDLCGNCFGRKSFPKVYQKLRQSRTQMTQILNKLSQIPVISILCTQY